jgi:hypothetical protein
MLITYRVKGGERQTPPHPPTSPPTMGAQERHMLNTPFEITLENLPVILPGGEDVLCEVTVRGTMYPYREATLYDPPEGGPEVEEVLEGTYEDEEGVVHTLDRATLDMIERTCSCDLHDLTVEELAPDRHGY